MTTNAIQELEMKVAFLEEALNKLSDEHYAQQKELEKLKTSNALILETLRNSGIGNDGQADQQHEVPPHY